MVPGTWYTVRREHRPLMTVEVTDDPRNNTRHTPLHRPLRYYGTRTLFYLRTWTRGVWYVACYRRETSLPKTIHRRIAIYVYLWYKIKT